MQNACATNQVMQFIGRSSFPAGLSVQVANPGCGSHLSCFRSAAASTGRIGVQLASHPVSAALLGSPPDPCGGSEKVNVLSAPAPAGATRRTWTSRLVGNLG